MKDTRPEVACEHHKLLAGVCPLNGDRHRFTGSVRECGRTSARFSILRLHPDLRGGDPKLLFLRFYEYDLLQPSSTASRSGSTSGSPWLHKRLQADLAGSEGGRHTEARISSRGLECQHEYLCDACGNRYEKQEFHCEGEAEVSEVRQDREPSDLASIVFKGSGFYKTDSRGADTSSSSSTSTTTTDTPPAVPDLGAAGHSHGPGSHTHDTPAPAKPAKSDTSTESAAAG